MYKIEPVKDTSLTFDMLKKGGKVNTKAKAKAKQKQSQKVIINIGSKQVQQKKRIKQQQPSRPIFIDRPIYIQGQQGRQDIVLPINSKIEKAVVGELKDALNDNKIDTKEFGRFDKLIKEQNDIQQSLKKSILEEADRKRTEVLAEPPSFEEIFGEQKYDIDISKIRDDYVRGLTLKNQKQRERRARKKIEEVESLRGIMAEELREQIENLEEEQKQLISSQSGRILERMRMTEPDAQQKFDDMMKKATLEKDK